MPLISQFYGILIRFFFNDQEQHHIPHFHAVYGEYSCSFSLDGEVLAGNIPKKQQKLIVAWVVIHQEELEALWKSIQETGDYFTIKGLA
jgi:hypothetical protein